MGYRTISRPLVEGALSNPSSGCGSRSSARGPIRALVRHLEDVRDRHGPGFYHIIHFDLHGVLLAYDEFERGCQANAFFYQARYARPDIARYDGEKAFLAFAADTPDQSDLAEAGEVADLLKSHQVPVAVLNACQSGKQVGARETSLGSRLMQAGVQVVVAMGYSVTVSAARLMMTTLYGQLFAGSDLATAIRRARLELFNQKSRREYFDQTIDLEDWVLPVVYQNQELLLKPRELTSEEWAEVYGGSKTKQYPFPKPAYGFHGRDVDILEIERPCCPGTTSCSSRAWAAPARRPSCTTSPPGGRRPASWTGFFTSGTTRRPGTASRSSAPSPSSSSRPKSRSPPDSSPSDSTASRAHRREVAGHPPPADPRQPRIITGSALAIPNTLPPEE